MIKYYNKLTPLRRLLLEKLIVGQLVMKFPPFMEPIVPYPDPTESIHTLKPAICLR
jgi:hypothetical protein